MTFSWSNTNFGGKLILISTMIAIISIFLPWIDKVIHYTTGWKEYAFVLLIFYIYPVLQVIKNKSLSLLWGSTTSIIPAVAVYTFMEYQTIHIEGVDICWAGQGAYLFFVACVFLFAGVLKYKASEMEVSEKSTIEEK